MWAGATLMHACRHAYTHACMDTRMHASCTRYMYICMYIHTSCVYIYICIYIPDVRHV